MSTAFDTPSTESRSNNKPLWIAIGVLGAAVVAMGGTLAYNQLRPQPVVASVADSASLKANETLVSTEKQPVAGVESAPTAPKVVAVPAPKATPKPAPPQRPAPNYASRDGYPTGNVSTPAATNYPPAVVQSRPICANCGSIESVTPIERAAPTNGLGAVAGGVLGAIVGNQVGHGNGRAAATVLGAVGGGYAGNAVEKNVRKATAYQVRVRMEDGSVRTIEQSQPASVGARVTVEGNTLRASDNVGYAPPARNQPVYNQTGSAY
jgi:outer membrane lipoprotein SlyB